MLAPDFLALLHCPDTGHKLSVKDQNHLHNGKGLIFPLLNGIPWLFRNPGASLAEWKARLQFALSTLNRQSLTLDHRLKQDHSKLPSSTQKRISILLEAKKRQKQYLEEILSPLALLDSPALELLSKYTPSTQHIYSYFSNIFRDWAWETQENQDSLNLIQKIAPENWGKTLILGSGAGRLAWDLHHHYKIPLTVCLDINPLLTLVAQKVFQAEGFELYEFPETAQSPESAAVLHQFKRQGALQKDIHLLLADGLDAPFAADTFDTIVTPWFIDIVPMETQALCSRMNHLLKAGGKWINFGPLGYSHSDLSWRYTAPELKDLCLTQGFTDFRQTENSINYLSSPYSGMQRRERVIAFSCSKKNSVTMANYKPNQGISFDFIENPQTSIPLLPAFSQNAESYRLYAQILSTIDGKISFNDLSSSLQKTYGISNEDARQALKNLLLGVIREEQDKSRSRDS